jgi:hypothetical protein
MVPEARSAILHTAKVAAVAMICIVGAIRTHHRWASIAQKNTPTVLRRTTFGLLIRSTPEKRDYRNVAIGPKPDSEKTTCRELTSLIAMGQRRLTPSQPRLFVARLQRRLQVGSLAQRNA